MKLRATIVLLSALVICAASQPQPNSENPRDARKIRYGQRQQLANQEASPSSVGDPNAPLSLLPDGAEPGAVKDLPNEAPKPGELTNGVTATVSIETAPSDGAGTVGGVRSLAIDGAPFGEVRRKVERQPALDQSPRQVVATASQPLPTLRGPQAAGQLASEPQQVTTPATSTADQKPATPAGQPRPASAAKAVANNSAQAKVPATTVPVSASKSNSKSKVLAQAEAVPAPARVQPQPAGTGGANADSDTFKWLDTQLGKQARASNVSASELRHSPDGSSTEMAAVDATALAAGTNNLDPAQLEPLGIPGEAVAQAPPGRLARTLLGAAGVLALVLLAVAVPRPRRRSHDEGLTLIETIGLEGDRQLVILRKKHYALVLGVTRSATHLLEKVSMASLDSDYHSVIGEIIKRESETPELWRMRPLFSSSWRTDYAPEERAAPARRTSLGELRASLQVVGPTQATHAPAPVHASLSELRQRGDASLSGRRRLDNAAANREVVIRRIREQARRAS